MGRARQAFGSNCFVPWKQSHPQERGPGPPWSPEKAGTRGLRPARPAQRGPGRPARPALASSRRRRGCAEGTSPCALLRAARSGEAALLGSGGRGSSPYRSALMIFLKERDSCEQTGLTGTAPSPHPQGISFCLHLTSKSVGGPCQRRDGEEFGGLSGRPCGPGRGGWAAAGPCRRGRAGPRWAAGWTQPDGKGGDQVWQAERARGRSVASGPGTCAGAPFSAAREKSVTSRGHTAPPHYSATRFPGPPFSVPRAGSNLEAWFPFLSFRRSCPPGAPSQPNPAPESAGREPPLGRCARGPPSGRGTRARRALVRRALRGDPQTPVSLILGDVKGH